MRIAISGKQGAGKSELAKVFIDKYGFEHLSFAKAVKQEAMDEYGLTYEQAFGKEKDRELLQKIGYERRESEGENYWVDKVINGLDEDTDYVLDDLRYKSEFDALKEAGFIMVRIICSEDVRRERIPETFGNPNHISETDLDDVVKTPTLYKLRDDNKRYWDIHILNETIDIDRLRGCADSIYKSLSI